MKKLYIVTTVGGFDMEAANISDVKKLMDKHAATHLGIKMGIYKLVKTAKVTKRKDGRIKWTREG